MSLPSPRALERVNAQADIFTRAPVEFRFQARRHSEFGCADRRVIFRVRKQNAPTIAKPFVKFISPSVVCAVKSGASSPSLIVIAFYSLLIFIVQVGDFAFQPHSNSK
jgi:hypothetical protein